MHYKPLKWIIKDFFANELKLLNFAIILSIAGTIFLAFLTNGIAVGVQQSSLTLLGADKILTSSVPLNVNFADLAQKYKINYSRTCQFYSMVASETAQTIILASVKAVSRPYPLYGNIHYQTNINLPPSVTQEGPSSGEIWVSSDLLQKLNITIGERITLGTLDLLVRGIIVHEPNQLSESLAFAPRALINWQDVESSQLIAPGSRVKYQYYFAGPAKALTTLQNDLVTSLSTSYKWTDANSQKTSVAKALEHSKTFIEINKLFNIIMSGVILFIAGKNFEQRKTKLIGLFSTLGISRKTILYYYSIGLVTIILIIGFTAFILASLSYALAKHYVFVSLHVNLANINPKLILLSFLYSVFFIGTLILPRLIYLGKVPAMFVFRNDHNLSSQTPVYILITGGLSIYIAAKFSLYWASICLLGVSVTYFSVVFLLKSLAMLSKIVPPVIKLALRRLQRLAVLNAIYISAFSLIATFILVVSMVYKNLLADWNNLYPEKSSHFIANIEPEKLVDVKHFLAANNITHHEFYPMIIGELTHINNQSTTGIHRPLNLTFSANIPQGNDNIAGTWSKQNSGLSVEVDFAKRLNIHMHDKLTFMIGDRTYSYPVVHLRKAHWEKLSPNFFVIFPENSLHDLPYKYMSSFYLPVAQHSLITKLILSFPHINVFDINHIITELNTVISKLINVVAYLWQTTIAISFILFISILANTIPDRIKESCLLQALGANKRQIIIQLISEFVIIGCITSLISIIIAEASYRQLTIKLFNLSPSRSWSIYITHSVIVNSIILIIGIWLSRKVITVKTFALLKNSNISAQII